LVYVRLDHKHMGVGGDDSWSPRVHKEFQLTDNQYANKVTFKPAQQAIEDINTRQCRSIPKFRLGDFSHF
ncbi:hypothetical protein KIV40_31835, partial [Vibrio sp. D173a]